MICMPTHTYTLNRTQTRPASCMAQEQGKFAHSPLKRGCPFSVMSGIMTVYRPSEKPGRHGGAPLLCAALCDGGGEKGNNVS